MTHPSTRHRFRWFALSLAVLLVAGGLTWRALAGTEAALLLADTDRDGRVTAADAVGRGDWTAERGAIVVPNLDDDGGACPTVGDDGERLSDDELAGCADAADEEINGESDLRDLAPLRIEPLPGVSPDASATVTVDDASRATARVFVRDADGVHTVLNSDDPIAADRLHEGVDLALEATDFARDAEAWDGHIAVTLTVRDGETVESDQARVRVAPLLLSHDLAPIEQMVVADNDTSPESAERDGYQPDEPADPIHEGEDAFRSDLSDGLESAGLDPGLTMYPTGDDRWMRDQFISGYATMPGPDGEPHVITVLLRSAVVDPEGSTTEFPLRDAGRPAFSLFRGDDTAAVQTYSPDRVGDDDYNALWGSFNSTGNVIVAPPYSSEGGEWPSGRILYGSDGGDAAPDPAFVELLAAQDDQDPLAVDTSWLGVGHIDEFLSFVPADNDRGWAAVVADPALGTALLEEVAAEGLSDQTLVRDIAPGDTEDPGMTVEEALETPKLVAGNEIAAEGIDAALEGLTAELDLGEEDIVRVPALFGELVVEDYPRQDIVANYLPAIVNGVESGTGIFLAIDPHSPAGADGRDVFAAAAEMAFAEIGGQLAWVEAWDYGHSVGDVGGEIHCLTNTLRDQSGTEPWWEA